jgi:hypothetical protein
MAFAAARPDASAQAEAAQAMAGAVTAVAVVVVVDRPSQMGVERSWSPAAEVALPRVSAETQTRVRVVSQEP